MKLYAVDLQEPFNHKCVFDIGDLGLGVCANSLELGCDCLGHIKYFDGTINSPQGRGHSPVGGSARAAGCAMGCFLCLWTYLLLLRN